MRWLAALLACALAAGCARAPTRAQAQAPAAADQPASVQASAAMEANRRAEASARRGDLDVAAARYREALRLSLAVEDAEGIAANALSLSVVLQRQGKYEEARASLAPLLEGATLEFPPERRAQAALRRAVLDLDERRAAPAADWAARAAAWCGSPCALAAAIRNVQGQLALEAGRREEAAQAASEALAAARRASDAAETANALRLSGFAAVAGGNGAAAAAPLAEALAIDQGLGAPRKIALDLIGLGRAAALRGEREAAHAYYARALAVSEADRDAAGAAEARAHAAALGGAAGSR
jgi:tetratricopeptide (TPR) repeat protein